MINGLSHSLHFALCRPFKNLLRKIRDLLLTLTPGELFVLERLLCQLEEPTDLEKKLQVGFTSFSILSFILSFVPGGSTGT